MDVSLKELFLSAILESVDQLVQKEEQILETQSQYDGCSYDDSQSAHNSNRGRGLKDDDYFYQNPDESQVPLGASPSLSVRFKEDSGYRKSFTQRRKPTQKKSTFGSILKATHKGDSPN
jgi:hypothetical protein